LLKTGSGFDIEDGDRAVLLKIALAVALLLAAGDAASACVASPETIHNREIALIYTGLKKAAFNADDLAMVTKLEAQAERLHRARKFEQAQEARHAALIKIGYRQEPTPESAAPPQSGPLVALNPATIASAKGCGGGVKWIAPNS
jgi:hypothetical protein